jgi:hypothetical protein
MGDVWSTELVTALITATVPLQARQGVSGFSLAKDTAVGRTQQLLRITLGDAKAIARIEL